MQVNVQERRKTRTQNVYPNWAVTYWANNTNAGLKISTSRQLSCTCSLYSRDFLASGIFMCDARTVQVPSSTLFLVPVRVESSFQYSTTGVQVQLPYK